MLKDNIQALITCPEAINTVHENRKNMAEEMARSFCKDIWVTEGVAGEWFQVYMTSPCIDCHGMKNTVTTYLAIKSDESVMKRMADLAVTHKADIADPNKYDHDRT